MDGMDLGFETIGNACLIFHDNGPVLATDPWLSGSAYFGSWILSHQVPPEQQAHVAACKWLWISHGHPDHLSLPSLEKLRDKQLLLPDHHGSRVADDLRGMGFKVQVLRCGEWQQLTPRLRVACIANYNQDAVLLVDLDGHLIIDANDAGDRGARAFLQRELPRFSKQTFLACLLGYGDADMINFFDEQGNRVPPLAMQHQPVGPQVAEVLHGYGIGNYLPSSSQHRYQRTDSLWANECITPEDQYDKGFVSDRARCLPAFLRYDLIRDEHSCIDPPSNAGVTAEPAEFGDDWSTPLEVADVEALRRYFGRFEHLRTFLGHLTFRVGGKDHTLDIEKVHRRGITFAVPRNSLMQAVEWNAFDDLLIGNFMRTTMHGDWWGKQGADALYPHFTPFVTKFGDNGGARTAGELRAYFADYLRRGFTDFDLGPADREMRQALRPYL
ncbi:MAG: MBL fold metallo-hydrolase [Planctomycetota bacterium]